jgi:hypothetical protein
VAPTTAMIFLSAMAILTEIVFTTRKIPQEKR